MDHIGILPEDDAVAVGMGMFHMLYADLVAVQMQLDPVMIGYHRQGFRSSRWDRIIALDQPVANMILGHDQHAGLTEILVTAGMVIVPVGVDQIFDRSSTEVLYRCLDLVG